MQSEHHQTKKVRSLSAISFVIFFSDQPNRTNRERNGDLREEIGDVEALGDESEQALESFALLGVELAVEEGGDADIVGVVVEVGVGANPEHHCGGLAQSLRRRAELREHLLRR